MARHVLLALLCFLPCSQADNYRVEAIVPCANSLQATMPALYTIGVELKSAFRLGCDMVNADFNSSGISLLCEVACCGASADSAADAAHDADQALAIVGGFGADDALAIAQAVPSVPVITPAAPSATVNVSTIPNFFRISAAQNIYLNAIMGVLQSSGFWQVAVIGGPKADLAPLLTLLNQSKVEVLCVQQFYATDNTTVDNVVKSLADCGSSVFIAMADPDSYATLTRRAALAGLTGAQTSGTYVWLSTSAVLSKGFLQSNVLVQQALQGTLDVRPRLGSGDTWDRLLAMWKKKTRQSYPGEIFATGTPLPYVSEILDAVYAVANAIKVVKDAGNTPTGDTLLQAMNTVSFIGATGPVSFNGARLAMPPVSITNLIRWQWVEVGQCSTTAYNFSSDAMLWPGGSLTVPIPRQVVSLAAVLPCHPSLANGDNSNYLVGLEMCSAFKIACKDLEAHRTFAPGYRIRCILLPGNSSTSYEQMLVRSQMDNVVGFVGDRTASLVIAMQSVLGPLGIPQVGLSSAAELSNATIYPSYFRTVPSDAFQAIAIADIVRNFGWQLLGIISVNSTYGQGISQGLIATLGSDMVAVSVKFPENCDNTTFLASQLTALDNEGVRVIFIAGVGDDCLKVMATAYRLNMTGPKYTWIASSGCVAQDPSALRGDAGRGMQGILGVALVPGSGALYQALAANWATLDPVEYPGQIHQGLLPGPRAGVTYDAVYVFANALALLRRNGIPRQAMNRTALSNALLNVNFTGTTGPVHFDTNGDRIPPVYSIVNLQGYTFQPVGSWSDSTRLVLNPDEAITWPGGSLIPPSGRPHTVVTVGALLPIDPSLAVNNSFLLALGRQVQAAIRLACQDVNEGILLSHEISLHCIFESTKDDPDTALIAARNATSSLIQQGAVAILGAIRSPHTIAVQPIIEAAHIPMISPGSKATILSNATAYPNFFRTVPPDSTQAKALAALWVEYQWDHVAILATDDAYAAGLADDLVRELSSIQNQSVTVLLNLRYPTYSVSPPIQQMEQIRDSPATIIFISCVSTDCVWALRAAMAVGLTPKKYQLVSCDGMAALAGAWGNSSDVWRFAHGMVGTTPRGGSTYLWQVVKTRWDGLDQTQYPGPGAYCPEAYDAVLAVAMALTRIPWQRRINGSLILDQLRSPDFVFNGTTGLVGFDSNQDPIDAGWNIWNMRWGRFFTVGSYDTLQGITFGKDPIVWSGLLEDPPAGKKLRIFQLAGVFQTHPLATYPGRETEAAFRIACEDANAATDLLVTSLARLQCKTYPTYGLAYVPGNQSNIDNVTQQIISAHANGILGAAPSANSLRIQELLNASGVLIPQISFASTDTLLSNESLAPTFFRTCPTDAYESQALASVIVNFFPQCRQVAMLYTSDLHACNLADGFRLVAKALNIRIVLDKQFSPSCAAGQGCDIPIAVQAVKQSQVAIIVLLAVAADAIPLLQEASTQGLVQNGYAWFGPQGIGTEAMNINAANKTQLFQGFISTVPRGGTGRMWDDLVSRWRTKDPLLFPSEVFTSGTPGRYTGETYDAVMAFVHALDYMADHGRPFSQQALFQALKEVNFEGTTGMVRFDINGDRNYTEYAVVNFQANRFVEVGSWLPTGYRQGRVDIIWPTNRLGSPPDACVVQVVKLYGAFPLQGDEVDSGGTSSAVNALGQELNSAFLIACEAVNKKDALLGNIRARLNCESFSTGGTPDQTVQAMNRLLRGHIIAGVVGSVRNSHTAALAAYLGANSILQISPAATAIDLDSRTKYPYFYRTSPSLSTHALYLVHVIRQFGWKQVAIIHSGQPDSNEYTRAVVAALKTPNITLLTKAVFTSSAGGANIDAAVASALTDIKSSGAAVIILSICKGDPLVYDVQRTFSTAKAKGMTGPGWTWLVTGDVVSAVPALFSGSDGQAVQQAMQGVVGLVPRLGYGPLYERLLHDWRGKNPQAYPGQIFTEDIPQVYVSETFDAVLTFAQALTSLAAKDPTAMQSPTLSAQLADIISSPGFQVDGTSGQLSFSTKGDPLTPTFEVVNLQGNRFVSVGLSDSWNSLTLNKPIIWPGGSTVTPPDARPSLVQELMSPKLQGWVIAIIVIFVLLIALCIMISVMVILERKGKGLCIHEKLDEQAQPPNAEGRL